MTQEELNFKLIEEDSGLKKVYVEYLTQKYKTEALQAKAQHTALKAAMNTPAKEFAKKQAPTDQF